MSAIYQKLLLAFWKGSDYDMRMLGQSPLGEEYTRWIRLRVFNDGSRVVYVARRYGSDIPVAWFNEPDGTCGLFIDKVSESLRSSIFDAYDNSGDSISARIPRHAIQHIPESNWDKAGQITSWINGLEMEARFRDDIEEDRRNKILHPDS
jgi:hypothetical protein